MCSWSARSTPHNASRKGVEAACERSLRRLGVETIDLYLLHWPGSHPISETIEGFEALRAQSKIAAWGVSNFDVAEMEDVVAAADGQHCATNQVLFNVSQRGPEAQLMPWLSGRGIPTMAYSPLDRGALRKPALERIARRHNATAAQIALAFTLLRPDVIAIPKASSLEHVRQNAKAQDIVLTAEDNREVDAAFPPPKGHPPLAVY